VSLSEDEDDDEISEVGVVITNPYHRRRDPENVEPRKVFKRMVTLKSMNVATAQREQFNLRTTFKAPSGALIELQASNHSMFSCRHFQK